MDGIQYCRDKVAPLGSNAYYCLLWLPPAEAGGVLAALALRQELLDIPEKVSDGQLALTKLNWWRDELRRTAGGVAQHPVSQVLRPVLQSRPQLSAGMASMCDGIDMLLQTGRINDEAAFGLMNQRLGGCAWQLAAELAGAQEPAELRFAAEAGCGLHLLETLQQLRPAAQRGLVLVPVSVLQRHNLPVEQVAAGNGGDAFVALATEMIATIRAHFALARAQLKGRLPRRLRFVLSAMCIAEATIREIERDGVQYLQQRRVSLTPLRKLWLAWKSWHLAAGRT